MTAPMIDNEWWTEANKMDMENYLSHRYGVEAAQGIWALKGRLQGKSKGITDSAAFKWAKWTYLDQVSAASHGTGYCREEETRYLPT